MSSATLNDWHRSADLYKTNDLLWEYECAGEYRGATTAKLIDDGRWEVRRVATVPWRSTVGTEAAVTTCSHFSRFLVVKRFDTLPLWPKWSEYCQPVDVENLTATFKEGLWCKITPNGWMIARNGDVAISVYTEDECLRIINTVLSAMELGEEFCSKQVRAHNRLADVFKLAGGK